MIQVKIRLHSSCHAFNYDAGVKGEKEKQREV